jgi:hypothetical protein
MNTSKTTDVPFSNEGIVRDLIKHENDLLNHRLTWFITIQGLLFAALGFAWSKSDAKELVFVFCGLGILTAVSSAFALWGGANAIDQLSTEEKIDDQPIIGRRAGIEKFAYPWYSFPVLFGAAWGSILWINLQTMA